MRWHSAFSTCIVFSMERCGDLSDYRQTDVTVTAGRIQKWRNCMWKDIRARSFEFTITGTILELGAGCQQTFYSAQEAGHSSLTRSTGTCCFFLSYPMNNAINAHKNTNLGTQTLSTGFPFLGEREECRRMLCFNLFALFMNSASLKFHDLDIKIIHDTRATGCDDKTVVQSEERAQYHLAATDKPEIYLSRDKTATESILSALARCRKLFISPVRVSSHYCYYKPLLRASRFESTELSV